MRSGIVHTHAHTGIKERNRLDDRVASVFQSGFAVFLRRDPDSAEFPRILGQELGLKLAAIFTSPANPCPHVSKAGS